MAPVVVFVALTDCAFQFTVAFPVSPQWQHLEEVVMVDKNKRFMARPPPPSIAYEDLTPVQRWAVDLGVDPDHQILYLCGKAGSGKTEIALHICQRMKVSLYIH